MDLIVVPFLLAAHVPTNDENPRMLPESTFYVHVNSMYTIENGNIRQRTVSNFTSKFMCNSTARDKLSCYFKNPKLIITSTVVSKANLSEVFKKTAVNIPFDYTNGIPIEMVFNYFGIVEFHVANDAYLSKYFLDLFRMIANQMNIGTNIKRKENMFVVWAESNIGTCLTEYTVNDKFDISYLTSSDNKFTLKPISDFDFEHNRIKIIEKYRHVDRCFMLNDYMFITKYINTYFPVHHEIIKSVSRMQISGRQFTSETENKCKVYNHNEMEVGFAVEHVYLRLDTI